tara:strand:- start:4881 stop:5669 length:789 start_codon:yes stop_codon:yes gene_type:complete
MTQLTVGLPMYRSNLTAYAAFESLASQKNVDFEWELLIIEEEQGAYGLDNIREFVPRLKEVGCTRLEYVATQKWVHLSHKWKKLAEMSSDSSSCFLLKAADCYSQPYRLKETYDIFTQDPGTDWVQSTKGYFYQLELQKLSTFNHASPGYAHQCALNMSLRTDLLKRSRPAATNSVDRDLINAARTANGGEIKVVWNDSENWQLGVDLDGISNFSRDRKILIDQGITPFEDTEAVLSDVVSAEMLEFIGSLEQYAANHRYMV